MSQVFSSDGLLHRQVVTPWKPGGEVTHWVTSNTLVGDVVSDLMF